MHATYLLSLMALLSAPVSGNPVSILYWGSSATSCDMTQPAVVNVSSVEHNTCIESNGVVVKADCLWVQPQGYASSGNSVQYAVGYGKMLTFDSMSACQGGSNYIGFSVGYDIGERYRSHCSLPYDAQAYAVDCTGQNYFDGSVQRNAKPFNISVVYWKNAKRCDASVPTTYAQQSVQNGLTVSAANGYNYTVQCWDNTVDSTYSIYVKTNVLDIVPRYQYLSQASGDSNNQCQMQRPYAYQYEFQDQQFDSFAVDCTGQNNFQNVYGTLGNRVTSALVYPVHQLVTVNGQSLYATSAVCGSDADCPQQATCTDNQCICKAGYGGDNTCNNKISSASAAGYTGYSALMIVLAVMSV